MVEYFLIGWFILNGATVWTQIPMPDYTTCVAHKQIWLAEAKRTWVKDPEAYCVARSK